MKTNTKVCRVGSEHIVVLEDPKVGALDSQYLKGSGGRFPSRPHILEFESLTIYQQKDPDQLELNLGTENNSSR